MLAALVGTGGRGSSLRAAHAYRCHQADRLRGVILSADRALSCLDFSILYF